MSAADIGEEIAADLARVAHEEHFSTWTGIGRLDGEGIFVFSNATPAAVVDVSRGNVFAALADFMHALGCEPTATASYPADGYTLVVTYYADEAEREDIIRKARSFLEERLGRVWPALRGLPNGMVHDVGEWAV